jgi:hypothetical protein
MNPKDDPECPGGLGHSSILFPIMATLGCLENMNPSPPGGLYVFNQDHISVRETASYAFLVMEIS